MSVAVWKATPPQATFWRAWYGAKDWALAFVAGFGSGKSEALHIIAVSTIIKFPWASVAVYSPTYDLLKLNNIPRISELLDSAGLSWTYNKADFIFSIKDHGKIICRSMDTPGRIIAYEVYASLIDELDTMTTKKAEEAWDKIISRNRQQPTIGQTIPAGTYVLYDEDESALDYDEKIDRRELVALEKDTACTPNMEVLNKCGVFTTPEGFKFTYRKWKKEANEGYCLIKAPTSSNPHLPKSYIKNLRNTYSSFLIEAYIEGEFVNLNGHAVYHAFDRFANHTEFTFTNLEEKLLYAV